MLIKIAAQEARIMEEIDGGGCGPKARVAKGFGTPVVAGGTRT